MAEEVSAAAPTEAPAPTVTAASTEPTVDTKPDETTAGPKIDEQPTDVQPTSELTAPEGENETADAVAPFAAAADGEDTPASSSKKEKRKSTGGGVPEHKSKKLNKKKSMPVLRPDCKPGEQYWARLKGYPPWPAIICDEQMLPESLLASRPVSTTRPDGTLRDDFKEGGKNAKERTFPIMFLSTNEFTWMVNTSLTPLDPEECNTLPKSKMTKALTNAWKLASENHDLDYFKNILKVWQEEQAAIEKEIREQEEEEARRAEERAAQAEKDAAEAAKEEEADKKKKKPRKSKGGDGDVDMEDADAPKSTKKRKKDTESDGEKPKKTPKVTKLSMSKTPNGEASGKKTAPKSKKKVVQAPSDAEEDAKPQMSEAERLQTREKAVLYLRHRLQKGFLSRDQAPQENEMTGMAEFFSQLEAYENLEPAIIRTTKIHKVLKAIVKLSSIPKDDEYQFKKRSSAMLEIWNKRMEADGDAGAPPKSAGLPEEKAPEANGVKEESAAPAPAATSETPMEIEEAAKEGAEKADEPAKVDETAEKLDDKIEEVVPAEEKKEPAPEASAEAAVTEPEKPVVPAVDAMDISLDGEAPKETETAAVTETAPETT